MHHLALHSAQTVVNLKAIATSIHLFIFTNLKNASSCIYLLYASSYFRMKGDFYHTIDCLQRALYYGKKLF
jgi:hypothetical protein